MFVFEAIEKLPECLQVLLKREMMSDSYQNNPFRVDKSSFSMPEIIDSCVNFDRSELGNEFWNAIYSGSTRLDEEGMKTLIASELSAREARIANMEAREEQRRGIMGGAMPTNVWEAYAEDSTATRVARVSPMTDEVIGKLYTLPRRRGKTRPEGGMIHDELLQYSKGLEEF